MTLSDTIVVMSEGKIQQIGTPIDIYNEPINSFVADFIGESNILNGTMLKDKLVRFCGTEFECVDEGFGENVPVDVVIRPEDLYIFPVSDMAQLVGVVQSSVFKGVHYEMTVLCNGYEFLVQDYHHFEVGAEVGLLVKPFDIHIMRKEKFTKSISEFYDVYFAEEGHVILYLREDQETMINNNLSIEQKEMIWDNSVKSTMKLLNTIKNYDCIVLHSLFLDDISKGLFLLNKGVMKKIVWIEWGFDLYSWRGEWIGINKFIHEYLNKAFRTKVYAMVGIFPPDCDYYRNEYPKSKTKVFYAPYCSAKVAKELQNYTPHRQLRESRENGQEIYIQVGHNAMESLNHKKVLDSLKHFANEKIKIFLPLSYGNDNDQYAKEVAEYAQKLFPGKTIVLNDFMKADEYFKLTKRIDIAIFDTKRQCGLGNINRMICRNVKLYMPKESVMYKYFRENLSLIHISEPTRRS